MNKICKENWNYSKIKELIAQLPQKTCKIVKDEPSLLIVQTFSVEPFRKLFVSIKSLKRGENNNSACQWCYCVPKTNRNWGNSLKYLIEDIQKTVKTNNILRLISPKNSQQTMLVLWHSQLKTIK